MTEQTEPCHNCQTLIPADIWHEELGFCVECSHEYWNHYPQGACGHFIEACCDDGNSFCPKCEGSGDFCRICSGIPSGHAFGELCGKDFCPVCSLGEVSA